MASTNVPLVGPLPDAGSNTETTEPTTSSALNPPSTAEVLAASISLDTIPRFLHLLAHAKLLISVHGPYSTQPGTTIFTRAPTQQPMDVSQRPSAKRLATSLAAAQDSIHTDQPAGPAQEDLQAFTLLWHATISVLDKLLDMTRLDQESFGWGVFGLSAGYGAPNSPASSSPDPVAEVSSSSSQPPDPSFTQLKQRLYAALRALPSLSSPQHGRGQYAMSGAQRVNQLVKAQREVHFCASLLVHKFRAEGWDGVRWGHGVEVATRWVRSLGLVVGTEEVDGAMGEMEKPEGSDTKQEYEVALTREGTGNEMEGEEKEEEEEQGRGNKEP